MPDVAITYDDGTVTAVVEWPTYEDALKFATLQMAAEVAAIGGPRYGSVEDDYADGLRDVLDALKNDAPHVRWQQLYFQVQAFVLEQMLPETIVAELLTGDAAMMADTVVGLGDACRQLFDKSPA